MVTSGTKERKKVKNDVLKCIILPYIIYVLKINWIFLSKCKKKNKKDGTLNTEEKNKLRNWMGGLCPADMTLQVNKWIWLGGVQGLKDEETKKDHSKC